ncbi:hypothetical protein MAM1_1072d11446 [Mucor ambiguus]|uniref:Uncharacterized protein n=1 Tax=Mucor ambiguus TaxID=91626 RepID=A0A0C9LZC0_9FUNG|nr:hypothetical protein MAM1_1072d11446 [Mucor ambiguus]
MVDSWCCVLGVSVLFTALLLLATAVAVYLLSWCLGARYCCDGRSLSVLAMLSLVGGACFCCLLSFICCLGAVYCRCCCSLVIVLVMLYFTPLVFASAVYCRSFAVYCCCCCSLTIAVLVMHSFGKLRLSGVCFCCCCRSFAVLVMLYRINLVLSAAVASIYLLLAVLAMMLCLGRFVLVAAAVAVVY